MSITWSQAALERSGISAKDLLVLAMTAPPVRPAIRLLAAEQDAQNDPGSESAEAAITRYVEMYEQSKPRPRDSGLGQGPSGGKA